MHLRTTQQFKTRALCLLFILTVLMCLDGAYTVAVLRLDALSKLNLLNVGVDCMGMLVCVILYGSILIDKKGSGDENSFLILIFLECLILFCDSTNWIVDGDPAHSNALWLSNIGLFVIILLIIGAFWNNIQKDLALPERARRIVDVIIVAMIIVGSVNTCLTCVTGWVFTIDDAGFYQRGDLIIAGNVPALVMMLAIMASILAYGTSTRRKVTAIGYTIIPIVATILQLFFYGISFLYTSLIVCLLLIYSNIYVSRGRDGLLREKELTEKRFQVMYSQIQPHFLYNSLTSIMNIKGNPQETVDAIADFGKYLRGNLETLSCKHAVPFRAEFEHLEIYLDLEKRRFKDKLDVVIDIQDRMFFIPALSIQMMVENAVRHGVTMRENGGRITIRTYCDEDAHYVSIEDDGVGFDTEILDDEDECIGISNVRSRLAEMVNGRMDIESTVGVGTKVLITIPRAKAQTVG
ncbi:MAG: histidine kinase [archaeon]|nr:histidine kinase [archaeon]